MVKIKLIKTLAAVGLAMLLSFQLSVPAAEASWGAYKLFNIQPSQEETQTPDTNEDTNQQESGTDNSNESDVDTYRLLRDKNYRWSYYNNKNSAQPSDDENNAEQPGEPQTPEEEEANVEEPGNDEQQGDYTASQEALRMLEMVNAERVERGLAPLMLHSGLTDLAEKKSREMVEKNYFSHTSPTMGSFASMVYNAGISYRQVGENLAKSRDVKKSHVLLMASDGHRKNILSRNFTHIGIGVVQDRYGVVITQLFIAQ